MGVAGSGVHPQLDAWAGFQDSASDDSGGGEGPRRLLKLLFFNHNVAWSGTFFRAFQLARALVGRGHQVTLVTTSRTAHFAMRREDRDGVEVIEAPDLFWGRGRTGWDPWNVLQRILGLRGARYDAVHAFDCRPAVILPALFHARSADLPLFIDWADWWGRGGSIGERHGRLINRLIGGVETWFEEAFRAHAVGTTVISRALEERAASLGVDPGRILRFPNGCEPVAPGEPTRAAAREELGRSGALSGRDELVVHIGLVYPADLALLLQAMAEVVRQRPAARLALIGNPRAPVPADALPAGALIKTGFVTFRELQAWLAASNVCVIPLRDTVSGRGRWPGKVNDYFAAGRAVVMPSVGDAAEYVDSARAGWTCAPTPAGFASALTLGLQDRDAADDAGRRGRALAQDELSWSTLVARVETFYIDTMRARPVPLAAAGAA